MSKRLLASVLPQHEAAKLYRLMVLGIHEVAVFLLDPVGDHGVEQGSPKNERLYGRRSYRAPPRHAVLR